MDNRPYSVRSLADRWSCREDHIRKLIRKGILRAFRVGDLVRITAAGIECFDAGYSHQTHSQWKVVRDGSLTNGGGLEVVSPVLRGADGFDQVRKVCAALATVGARVDRTCGLHVHVGVRDFVSLDFMKRLAVDYAHFESVIDMVMPASRRGSSNTYCRPMAPFIAQINAARSMDALQATLTTRYTKLNLTSFWRHGTVEFRQHSGTVEAEKMINWTKLCLRMVEAARAPAQVETVTETVEVPARQQNWSHARYSARRAFNLCARPEGATLVEIDQMLGTSRYDINTTARRYGVTLTKRRVGGAVRYFIETLSPARQEQRVTSLYRQTNPKTLGGLMTYANAASDEVAYFLGRYSAFQEAA